MSLNIKNEKTHRAIRELARLTGESMTMAVDKAVRERIQRVREQHKSSLQDKSALVKRILEIGKQCAAHIKEPYKSMDHGDLLYDEKGLPK